MTKEQAFFILMTAIIILSWCGSPQAAVAA